MYSTHTHTRTHAHTHTHSAKRKQKGKRNYKQIFEKGRPFSFLQRWRDKRGGGHGAGRWVTRHVESERQKRRELTLGGHCDDALSGGGAQGNSGQGREDRAIMWPIPLTGAPAWWRGSPVHPWRAGTVPEASGTHSCARRGRCPRGSCYSCSGCRPGSGPSPGGTSCCGGVGPRRRRPPMCCWCDLWEEKQVRTWCAGFEQRAGTDLNPDISES